MRLAQITDENGKRALVATARGESRLVKGSRTTVQLAQAALEAGTTLKKLISDRGVGKVGDGPAQPGYWIMGPLLLADGASVLVNLGFVPLEAKDAALRALATSGELTVSGVMRAPEERGPFIPADNPAKGQWYTRDPVAIATSLGLPRPAPFSIDADAHAAAPGAPAGGATVLDIPNNHLSYAATWYGLAATLAAFYAGFLWRRLRRAAA